MHLIFLNYSICNCEDTCVRAFYQRGHSAIHHSGHRNMNSSENEYARERNASRPSVIYFHGLSEKSTEPNNILDENQNEVKNTPDEDFTSQGERRMHVADTKICTRGW